jgi:riboflavin kinase/FMN adenylyltransferase
MELIRGLHNLKPRHRGCVATLGNFDGVHLGHQYILGKLREQGQALRLPTTVITTEPLSREFFAPDNAPSRLTRLREKLEILQALGIDRVLCLHFNRTLAELSAEAFVRDILSKRLGVRAMVIGDDLRFGHRRQGDHVLLQQLGPKLGFSLTHLDSHNIGGQRVSSTRIREALASGNLRAAGELLGRPYHISGRVVHGDKRGRTLGYPTANIPLHRRQTPLTGIFAVEVAGLEQQPLPAVASIGYRPTFGGNDCILEIHIFNFDRDIYQRHVQVRFLHKLREEERFDSVDALIAQMAEDVAQAKGFFQGRTSDLLHKL